MASKISTAALRRALTCAENEERQDGLDLAPLTAQEIKGCGQDPTSANLLRSPMCPDQHLDIISMVVNLKERMVLSASFCLGWRRQQEGMHWLSFAIYLAIQWWRSCRIGWIGFLRSMQTHSKVSGESLKLCSEVQPIQRLLITGFHSLKQLPSFQLCQSSFLQWMRCVVSLINQQGVSRL